jgi:hypothetical protein
MIKKELLFFSSIILIGFLDWLTTVIGVLFFGATEINPMFVELTKSSMVLFSAVKLSAVFFAGFTLYKAGAICRPIANDWHFTGRFLDGGYLLTLLALTAVVTNNIIAIKGP